MINEAEWESAFLDWLGEVGWQPTTGAATEPERATASDLVLRERFFTALLRLNPGIPDESLKQAMADMLTPASQDAQAENARFHTFLTDGYRGLTYVDASGIEQTPTLRLIGRDGADDFLAVQQVRIRQGQFSRRFDVVGYVNGLPLVIVELKQAGSASATVEKAHAQLGTYLREFPLAFRTIVATVISDGLAARYGTPFTPLHHYAPWNVDESGRLSDDNQLELLAFGLLAPTTFLDIARNFVAFDSGDGGFAKRIAKPHQYFAVTKALQATLRAVRSDGKAGVVWHTQGSGKSMEMELYANLVMRHPDLLNPTIVVITDRNDLDGQLFDTFDRSTLLPDEPLQVTTRAQLRQELSSRRSGGIIFTTLQKFGRTDDERFAGSEHPLLTDRRNVVVIVDEAHRSHYDDLDGYARHLADALPHATLIAFTGTPIKTHERDTRAVFGDYIDVYDLTRAVADGATVPVRFEPRLIPVKLADDVTPDDLDAAADEATVGLDDAQRERVERSVAVINAIYGAPQRIEALASDIVTHWEDRRARMAEAVAPASGDDPADPHGKALIVGGTREICAKLYAAIVALRPDWHSDAIDRGTIKVVYSGSASDAPPISDHVRRQSENDAIKERLRHIEDELELVVVKDMLLTGFDAPPLHTLYLDRPLQGALLMQTLARVNRTFRGKQDGLLVAYAPIAQNLTDALAEYTDQDRAHHPVGQDIAEAATLARQLVAKLDALVSGYDWRAVLTGPSKHASIEAVAGLVNYLRSPATPGNQVADDEVPLHREFRRFAGELQRAWALAGGSETLASLRNTIAFYEQTRVWMAKYDAMERSSSGEPLPDDIARILRGAVAEATEAGDVTDIYAAAGLPQPSLQELSPEVLAQMRASAHTHLAIEALRDLLVSGVQAATASNVVRRAAFSERIQGLMGRYTNLQLTSAEVIAALGKLAEEIMAEGHRGEQFDPPLTHDELAFYDAVSQNESAVLEQGTTVLAAIARELVDVMRRDTRTDWTRRQDVQAKLRASVKRLLRKHGYPPDKQEAATKLVLEQMEELAPKYAGGEA